MIIHVMDKDGAKEKIIVYVNPAMKEIIVKLKLKVDVILIQILPVIVKVGVLKEFAIAKLDLMGNNVKNNPTNVLPMKIHVIGEEPVILLKAVDATNPLLEIIVKKGELLVFMIRFLATDMVGVIKIKAVNVIEIGVATTVK